MDEIASHGSKPDPTWREGALFSPVVPLPWPRGDLQDKGGQSLEILTFIIVIVIIIIVKTIIIVIVIVIVIVKTIINVIVIVMPPGTAMKGFMVIFLAIGVLGEEVSFLIIGELVLTASVPRLMLMLKLWPSFDLPAGAHFLGFRILNP